MATVIRVKGADGGTVCGRDAAELVAEMMDKPCAGCGLGRATAVLRTYVPLADLSPDQIALVAAERDGRVPVVPFMDGSSVTKYVMVGETHACGRCLPAAERTAGSAGRSWWVVEVHEGPRSRSFVQVA